MVPPVRQVVKQGVPVVIIDSNLDPAEVKADPSLLLKYVATDNYNGGKLAGQHLLRVLAEAGKPAPRLVLFRYQPGSESTEQREQGFLDMVNAEIEKQKQAGQPVIELLDTNTYAEATVDTAQRAAGPMLTRLRDRLPDGIFAVNESATTGLLNAMRSQGLTRKIRVMGFDASEPLIQALRQGDLDGTIVQDPYRMGYLAVWVLVRHLQGDDVSVGGSVLGTGEYVVTKENLDSDAVRGLFDPEVQRQRVVKTPEFPGKK
jgi:ribose transport system substrate-binding protein